jgi:octaprenyl-diphosphate synthase
VSDAVSRNGSVPRDAELTGLVDAFFASSFGTDNATITEAVKRMLAAGGKRLRPRMTLLSAAACGGEAAEHLPLAAYMELIHVATLIHDDVVDNAAMRRGVNATAIDYGNRVSVLAGDYLFAWIFKNVTAGYEAPIPHILSATLADICDGEVLQLRSLGDLELSIDGYVDIASKKTASLFAASAQCGAIVGGGNAGEIDALRAFGEAFGVAFQMKDDLLDVTADERSLGKPVGNDLAEHKMTIPLIAALAAGNGQFRADVGRLYAGGGRDTIPALLQGIERQGGLSETFRHMERFVQHAKASLEPIAPSAAKEALTALADELLAG